MREPFEWAVEQHGATVLRVVGAVLGRGADADDAWQDTFLAALRSWPGLPDDANVEAWLVTVARRRALDVVRARNRAPLPVAELPEQPSTDGLPGAGDPELWDAVAELPERQRLAVACHYLGGLTHVQTAQVIGGTPAAVRRAAADGIANLRRSGVAHEFREETGGET